MNNNYNNENRPSAHIFSSIRHEQIMRKRQNVKQKFWALIFIAVFIVVLTFLFVKVIESDIFSPNKSQSISSPAVTSGLEGDIDSAFPTLPTEVPKFTFIKPIERTINLNSIKSPSAAMLALPENGTVDMSYFDNAVFTGDSLAQGFAIPSYDVFTNSGHASYKGMSPQTMLGLVLVNGKEVSPLDVIKEMNPAKIYILLGTNGLVWMNENQLITSFSQMLDAIGEKMPGVKIYLMSITPTTKEKAKDERFSNDYIRKVNDQLAMLTREKGVYFINLHEILADEEGNLNEDLAAGDGYHITATAYRRVRDYLQTHTAHAPDNPYLPGSPYYEIQNPAAE